MSSAGKKTGQPREPVKRLFLRPQEAADALSISVRKMRELIRAGTVPSVRLGRTRLVPVAALERLADVPLDHR
jgi:excisionase family DNA binding protein